MSTEDKSCEGCKFYHHTPNILGGIAECMRFDKTLNTFWINPACDDFQQSDTDNLKAQNDFYEENGVPLKLKSHNHETRIEQRE